MTKNSFTKDHEFPWGISAQQQKYNRESGKNDIMILIYC